MHQPTPPCDPLIQTKERPNDKNYTLRLKTEKKLPVCETVFDSNQTNCKNNVFRQEKCEDTDSFVRRYLIQTKERRNGKNYILRLKTEKKLPVCETVFDSNQRNSQQNHFQKKSIGEISGLCTII